MSYRFGLLLFVLYGVVFSQPVPKSYELRDENTASKISASTSSSTLSNTIEDILIDDNGTIWLATSRGLSKTEDGGETWTNYYETEVFGTEGISQLGYHDGVIWAATWHSEVVSDETIGVGTGLRYSSDNGETWTTIDQPVDAPGDTLITYGINELRALAATVPENNLVYDMDFTGDTIWVALFAAGLRKSADMGQTWQRVVLPPDYLDEISPDDTLSFALCPVGGDLIDETNYNHRVFSIKTINDSVIYVGTAGGINKSTDGISWQKFNHQNQDQPISGNHIVSLEYDSSDGTLWAATWKAVDEDEFWGVSSSSDGGETWETFLPGSRTQSFGIKYLDDGTDSDVFAATENGIYRTADDGSTWIANSLIVDEETNYQMTGNNFRDVELQELEDESYDIWVGSVGDGAGKLNEPADGFWEGYWTLFLASSEDDDGGTAVETFAFPNPFSPDEENIRIQYSTGGKTQDVTIRIFDFSMHLVRTLMQNAARSGVVEAHQDIWDGRDEKGNIVPNGVYFYRIDIGSDDPIYGKIMVLM